MAFSVEEGSKAVTVTTEHILNATTPETTECIMQFWLDPIPMLKIDELEIRIKEKVKAAGTQRLVFYATLTDTQAEAFLTPPLHLKNGWDVTIKQTLGTARTYDWSIRKVT